MPTEEDLEQMTTEKIDRERVSDKILSLEIKTLPTAQLETAPNLRAMLRKSSTFSSLSTPDVLPLYISIELSMLLMLGVDKLKTTPFRSKILMVYAPHL